MSIKNTTITVITFAVFALFATMASAEKPTPGYNTKVPESIMTPDKVETRIGTLEFFDGIPTKKTAQLCYDNLDFLRGVETFLSGIPATSVEGLRLGQASIGARNSNQVMLLDHLMDSNPLFLTGNTSTVYATAFLDLKKDGPTVVEIPPGAGPGTVNGLLPLCYRHGRTRPGQGQRRQVSDPPARSRG